MGLLLNPDPGLEEATKVVADQLLEFDTGGIKEINRAIQLLGMGKVCEIVKEAQEAHAGPNPPMVKDKSRQRTLGGCFFQILMEKHLTKAQRRRVFPWRGEKVKHTRFAVSNESHLEWEFNFCISREGDDTISGKEADELLDAIVAWAEKRQMFVGGGARPVKE